MAHKPVPPHPTTIPPTPDRLLQVSAHAPSLQLVVAHCRDAGDVQMFYFILG